MSQTPAQVRIPVWPGFYLDVVADLVSDAAQQHAGAACQVMTSLLGDELLIVGVNRDQLCEGLRAVRMGWQARAVRLADVLLADRAGAAAALMSWSDCVLHYEHASALISRLGAHGAQALDRRDEAGLLTTNTLTSPPSKAPDPLGAGVGPSVAPGPSRHGSTPGGVVA